MGLKGVIRNIVDFGAFVDCGVETDALLHRCVHTSVCMCVYLRSFLKTCFLVCRSKMNGPVEIGEHVDVTVVDIDQSRKRFSVSMSAGTPERHKMVQMVGPKRQRDGNVKEYTNVSKRHKNG